MEILIQKIKNFHLQSGFLIMIGFRNLFRQKRRNILLGSAMAFGVMILIIASSFSQGISDIMFNKIIKYVAGHVNVRIVEGKSRSLSIFRDRERLFDTVKKNAGESVQDMEEGIAVFVRAIGNGRMENLVLAGFDAGKTLTPEEQKEMDESFYLLEGKIPDLLKSDIENPVILSKEKINILNVKMGDRIRIKFRNIFGQNQSARLTVAGVMSNDNIFMQGVVFIDINRIKEVMGYRPQECGNIILTLKDPKRDAVRVADRIHAALKPGPAFIYAIVSHNGKDVKATVLPFMGYDIEKQKLIASSFTLTGGKMDDCVSRDGLMISDTVAARLGAAAGSELEFTFTPKFGSGPTVFKSEVKGVFRSDNTTGKDFVYMHDALFYPKFYENLPDLARDAPNAFVPAESASFKKALGKEWILLDRSRSTDDLKKKMRAAGRKKTRAAAIDVNSMYESASDVLKLENVLTLITMTAVLILFFIILIGVVNTLRMTIRERTREIGTIRAIGMQKGDVRSIFILETAFLTVIASAAGTVMAFIVMWGLSLVPFNISDNPLGLLLIRQRLYFLPTSWGIISNILFIIFISVATAFFPARRAANLSAAEALRHIE